MLNLFRHLEKILKQVQDDSVSKQYFVYILGSKNLVLYIGVTSNLNKRVYEHKAGSLGGFIKRYHVHQLLYFEEFNSPLTAIAREKQLKNWHREWKLNLIKSDNPKFEDLYERS